MPAPSMKPIIIEPSPPTGLPPGDRGKFLLYDGQFPVETDPKFSTHPGMPRLHRPHFLVSTVADFAFAGRLYWLQHHLKGKPYRLVTGHRKNTPLTLNGEPLQFRRVGRGGATDPRRFTLPDIERLAWALYQDHRIDGHELARISEILAGIAQQYWAHLPEHD